MDKQSQVFRKSFQKRIGKELGQFVRSRKGLWGKPFLGDTEGEEKCLRKPANVTAALAAALGPPNRRISSASSLPSNTERYPS
eukprot:evm.model.NODE_36730_length_23693_cov_36.852951.3